MDTPSASVADARVDELWATLDTRKQGHLDLAGLKKGLRKLDHPLKNADQLLDEVMQAVDTDGNGRITYQGGCVLSDRIARVLTRFENSANSYTKPKRSFSTYSRPSTTTTTARSPRTSCAQLCERPASQCPTVISTSSSRKWTPTMMGPSVLKNGGTFFYSFRSAHHPSAP